MVETIFRLVVRNPIACMGAILDVIGNGAFLSLEGDLSKCNLHIMDIISTQPNDMLKSSSSQQDRGFVIIPITENTIPILKSKVFPSGGLRTRIAHIQIARDGKLIFGAYDWFDKECVWITAEVDTKWLDDLVQRKIIWQYKRKSVNFNNNGDTHD